MIDSALLAALLADPRPGLLLTGDSLIRERVGRELAALLADRGHRVRRIPPSLAVGDLEPPSHSWVPGAGHVIMVASADLIDPDLAALLARFPALIMSAPELAAVPCALARRCCAVVDLTGPVPLRRLLPPPPAPLLPATVLDVPGQEGSGLPGLGLRAPGLPESGLLGSGLVGSGLPERGLPGSGLPERGLPGSGLPERGLPGQGLPERGLPGQGLPEQGLPGQELPERGLPGQELPEQGLPGQGLPGQGLPGQGLPGQGLPGQGLPEQGLPRLGLSAPERPPRLPGSGQPGSGSPEPGQPASGRPAPKTPSPSLPAPLLPTPQLPTPLSPAPPSTEPADLDDVGVDRERIAAEVVALADACGVADHGLEIGAARLAEALQRVGLDPRPILIEHVFGPRAATAAAPADVPAGDRAEADAGSDGQPGDEGGRPDTSDCNEAPDRQDPPGRQDPSGLEDPLDPHRDSRQDREREHGPDDERQAPERRGQGDRTGSDHSVASTADSLPAARRPSAATAPPRARVRRAPDGRRGPVITGGGRGRAGRVVPYGRRDAPLALLPTLRAALPWQPIRRSGAGSRVVGGRVVIAPEDLRGRFRRRRTGRLTILLVDASGSMGRDAVRTAKAMAVGLLDAAYQRRDEVAIVLARGNRAVLGLAPTRSRAKALHCLRRLPAGGGTPLADALLLAVGLAERYDPPAVELVIFTDGRANVGVGGDPKADAARAATVASARCGSVQVIEPTRSSWFGRGTAGWLTEALAAGSVRPTSR